MGSCECLAVSCSCLQCSLISFHPISYKAGKFLYESSSGSWHYSTTVKEFFSTKPMLYTWHSHPPYPHSVSERWRPESWDALEAGMRAATWTALRVASSGGEHKPLVWGGLLQSQCLGVLPLVLALGQHPSRSVLRPGNLVL